MYSTGISCRYIGLATLSQVTCLKARVLAQSVFLTYIRGSLSLKEKAYNIINNLYYDTRMSHMTRLLYQVITPVFTTISRGRAPELSPIRTISIFSFPSLILATHFTSRLEQTSNIIQPPLIPRLQVCDTVTPPLTYQHWSVIGQMTSSLRCIPPYY